MIKIFRKFRKQLINDKKPLKYLKYAFGEIILVVVGILIALQVNNWNQRQNDLENEKLYLTRLKGDLQSNIERGNYILYEVDNNYSKMLNIANQINNMVLNELDTFQLVYLTDFSQINSIAMSTSVYEEGKQNGILSRLENSELITEIQLHYKRVKDIEEYCALLKVERGQHLLSMNSSLFAFQAELSHLLSQTKIIEDEGFQRDSINPENKEYWKYVENSIDATKTKQFLKRYNWLFDRNSKEYKELISYLAFQTKVYRHLAAEADEIINRSQDLILKINKELKRL